MINRARISKWTIERAFPFLEEGSAALPELTALRATDRYQSMPVSSFVEIDQCDDHDRVFLRLAKLEQMQEQDAAIARLDFAISPDDARAAYQAGLDAGLRPDSTIALNDQDHPSWSGFLEFTLDCLGRETSVSARRRGRLAEKGIAR